MTLPLFQSSYTAASLHRGSHPVMCVNQEILARILDRIAEGEPGRNELVNWLPGALEACERRACPPRLCP